MNKTDKSSNRERDDALIAGHFQEMRASESTAAPALTRNAEALATTTESAPAGNYPQFLPRMAAAVALVAVAATLLLYPTAEDPAMLYANIMKEQQMQTDSLLIVSESILPAMSSLPSLYEIDLDFDSDKYGN